MITIIIPAHNEEQVIRRCLQSLLDGAAPGELDVIVCCNACNDETAAIARGFGAPVRVIETDVPSKTNAMNLGDEVAAGFPRLYVDADVVMSVDAVRALADTLNGVGILAAAPAVKTIFPSRTNWCVRAYYDLWMSLPYIQEGMMAAGVYAMNRAGRGRFQRFPTLIADDGFVRLQFTSSERVEVPTATSIVSAPGSLRDLIKIKTRSRLGVYELKSLYPSNFSRELKTKNYLKAASKILLTPRLYLAIAPYIAVNIISRIRAKRQFRRIDKYTWERDNSSRE